MVPFRPITVRSAIPFRKLSYSCKIRNETQSFRSGNYTNPSALCLATFSNDNVYLSIEVMTQLQ